jgi:hypothetical protein
MTEWARVSRYAMYLPKVSWFGMKTCSNDLEVYFRQPGYGMNYVAGKQLNGCSRRVLNDWATSSIWENFTISSWLLA